LRTTSTPIATAPAFASASISRDHGDPRVALRRRRTQRDCKVIKCAVEKFDAAIGREREKRCREYSDQRDQQAMMTTECGVRAPSRK